MNEPHNSDQGYAPASAESRPNADSESRGWYLYGIIRSSRPLPDVSTSSASSPAIQFVVEGALAAVVRLVTLVPSEDGALGMGLRTAQQLETMVREHNDVIAAVHHQRTILPSKFGCVYMQEEHLKQALRQQQEAMLGQLQRLEDCDEWGVHIYAEPSLVHERLARNDPRVRRLEDELATATPGKAYLLKRQLANLLAEVTGQSLAGLAREARDELARHAVDTSVGTVPRQTAKVDQEVEILRASFLVRRPESASFFAALHTVAEANDGLRCEYSGPWPLYSFVESLEEPAS